MVLSHQILPQKEAGIESASDLGVDLIGVVHEFFELFGEGDHAVGEGGQQFFDEIEIFVVFFAVDENGLSFKGVEGDLEIDLFEFFDEALGFLDFIHFHDFETYKWS